MNVVTAIQNLHDGMTARTLYRRELGQSFDMSTGVREGSIEGPTLWNIFYTFSLLDWAKRCKEKLGDSGGIYFEYTLDGTLRTGENNAKRGADTSNINDLEYADDLVVFETDPARFAEITNEFWMRRAKIGDRSYPSQKQNGCMYLRLLTTTASFPIFSFAQRRWSECTSFCIWVVSPEIATH